MTRVTKLCKKADGTLTFLVKLTSEHCPPRLKQADQFAQEEALILARLAMEPVFAVDQVYRLAVLRERVESDGKSVEQFQLMATERPEVLFVSASTGRVAERTDGILSILERGTVELLGVRRCVRYEVRLVGRVSRHVFMAFDRVCAK